jgi:hypothetical protein
MGEVLVFVHVERAHKAWLVRSTNKGAYGEEIKPRDTERETEREERERESRERCICETQSRG